MSRSNAPVCVESINAISILTDDYPELVLRIVDLSDMRNIFVNELKSEGYDDLKESEVFWLYKAITEMYVLFEGCSNARASILEQVSYEMTLTQKNNPATRNLQFIGVAGLEEPLHDIISVYIDLLLTYNVILPEIGVITEWSIGNTTKCYILVPGGNPCVENSHFILRPPYKVS